MLATIMSGFVANELSYRQKLKICSLNYCRKCKSNVSWPRVLVGSLKLVSAFRGKVAIRKCVVNDSCGSFADSHGS